MQRGQKWALGAGAVVLVLGGGLLLLSYYLPSDAQLAQRLAAEMQERTGVKAHVGSAHWALLPVPVVVVNDVRTQQTPPIVIRELHVHPNLWALLHRTLQFDRISVHGAVLPRSSVRALLDKAGHTQPDPSDAIPLSHLEFRQLTWISASGIAVDFDGEIDFDPNWRPRQLALRRPDIQPAFTLTLKREATADRWQTQIHVGGGTAHGHIALRTAKNGTLHLSGQLAPRQIEVASALQAFNRKSPVAGRGQGSTTLSASGKSMGELAGALHTRTKFSVHPATVVRFDLDKAIRTVGKEHDGQTTLDELSGQMDTQNTSAGMRVRYTDIKARTASYSLTGEALIYQRQINASGSLDIVEGAIGVPFRLRGPLAKPAFSIAPGFLAGAAVGTAIFPGVGTALGARLGTALGRLFNSDDKQTDAAKKK